MAYNIIGTIDLDSCFNKNNYNINSLTIIKQQLQKLHQDSYEDNDRILIQYNKDSYNNVSRVGEALTALQVLINDIDISNFFVLISTGNSMIQEDLIELTNITSIDKIPFNYVIIDKPFTKLESIDMIHRSYRYNSTEPVKISLDQLNDREKFLLTESKTFCMYPWIHLHTYPTGEAYPCCQAVQFKALGNTKKNTLKEIWNSKNMKQLRIDMLNETPNSMCTKCYEQEDSGFFSGRRSANKHHGHHIQRIHKTKEDGIVDDFKMTYWDLRFSNLCNLRCRSCGHIFSSSWYKDQVKLAGPKWQAMNQPLNYAGRFETDIIEQLIEHIDYVEQVYFAGGEPLMMDEHYVILEELERRKKFNVRLIYNTNFTQIKLKDRMVFDYWRKFDSVAVGASLDAMGPRAEYIRKGTKWAEIEENRRKMQEICPRVDFYISPTLSIMNALHIPDFHKNWVERGFINAQDLNVNILQDPMFYRIDIAPTPYKEKIKQKFNEHLEWLRPQDKLRRATVGFESALNYLENDNTDQLTNFWQQTYKLDEIRNENILEAIPELVEIKNESTK